MKKSQHFISKLNLIFCANVQLCNKNYWHCSISTKTFSDIAKHIQLHKIIFLRLNILSYSECIDTPIDNTF